MTHRNKKLLDVAHDAPCLLQLGRCEGQVVPCHSDQLEDGRGVGHKSHDCLAIPGCVACHQKFIRAYLGREQYADVYVRALKLYIVWQWVNERVRVA